MENLNLFTSNFKRFFKHLFLLLIVLISICIFMGAIFEKKIILSCGISGASKVNRILNINNVNEIPVFGSSRAQGSYVPDIIGENIFNYGIDGAGSNVWLFFLENELRKSKKTDIIINFDLTGFSYSIGDICNYIPNYPYTKSLMRHQSELFYNLPGIKYFGHYEYYYKTYLNERINLTKVTQKGGSFEKNVLLKKKFDELVLKRINNKDEFILNNNLSKRFEQLIKSTERRIFIVIAPYHPSYLDNFENIESLNRYLNKVKENENLYVVDYKNAITDNKFFFNTTHLNYNGAKLFSEMLKNRMLFFKNK